jgi:hypothetical protein
MLTMKISKYFIEENTLKIGWDKWVKKSPKIILFWTGLRLYCMPGLM